MYRDPVSRKVDGTPMMTAIKLGGLLLWFSPLVYLINPAWMAWSSVRVPLWSGWTGVPILLAGAGLLVWTFRSLGKNLTDTVVTRKQHTLVSHGPYRWVRHPLYSSAALLVRT